ncbi:MAG: glycosyltransferase [Thermomicrobiales bacterium]|nr:glycosyltransferase [Thermomicrobiales bacterium]
MSVAVSVVIPTCNRPDLLDRCLAALASQSLAPDRYELVIVDDAASEATRRQVAGRAERQEAGPALHYLPVSATQGPAAARNAGWRFARGEIIAFTDDDCVPDREWLAAGLRAMGDGASGVSGRVIVPLPERPTDYERNAAGLETAEFVTANCFYRRRALEAVGGFDERFGAAWREDSDLFFTLLERGEPLAYADEAVVTHPVRPARWGVSMRQQGKSRYNALLSKKHPQLFRERTQRAPLRHYYATVAALAGLLLGAVRRQPLVVSACLTLWSALTLEFAARRLRGTSRAPSHVAEMLVTSAAIPPLAVFWRLRGAVQFRVPFV